MTTRPALLQEENNEWRTREDPGQTEREGETGRERERGGWGLLTKHGRCRRMRLQFLLSLLLFIYLLSSIFSTLLYLPPPLPSCSSQHTEAAIKKEKEKKKRLLAVVSPTAAGLDSDTDWQLSEWTSSKAFGAGDTHVHTKGQTEEVSHQLARLPICGAGLLTDLVV